MNMHDKLKRRKVRMSELVFQRGDIVAFSEKNKQTIAVNIQNGAGNRFAPTIIVAEIELIPKSKTITSDILFALDQYPKENVKMVVNLGKIKTIDKKRVNQIIGQIPKSIQKAFDAKLEETFRFDEDEQGQVVFVDLGKEAIGSEQGGERPAIVLKSFTNEEETYYLVALMTSKMSKRAIPTHVMYEEGEAGIAKPSLALFEQLKYVKRKDVINYYEYTPLKKLPNIKQAFNISLGLTGKVKSGA